MRLRISQQDGSIVNMNMRMNVLPCVMRLIWCKNRRDNNRAIRDCGESSFRYKPLFDNTKWSVVGCRVKHRLFHGYLIWDMHLLRGNIPSPRIFRNERESIWSIAVQIMKQDVWSNSTSWPVPLIIENRLGIIDPRVFRMREEYPTLTWDNTDQ